MVTLVLAQVATLLFVRPYRRPVNPTVIRSVAVTTADVVAALETNETTSKRAVLRVLPPFNGRMRARLHLMSDSLDERVTDSRDEPRARVSSGESGGASADGSGGRSADETEHTTTVDNSEHALYFDPKTLVPDAPAYPRPTDTAAELRNDPDETYSVERHHEYHAEAVAQWREAVPKHIVETVTIETPHGDHDIRVRSLYKEF